MEQLMNALNVPHCACAHCKSTVTSNVHAHHIRYADKTTNGGDKLPSAAELLSKYVKLQHQGNGAGSANNGSDLIGFYPAKRKFGIIVINLNILSLRRPQVEILLAGGEEGSRPICATVWIERGSAKIQYSSRCR